MSPGPAAGTTGPIDLAGTMALATAEALACIAIAQMIRPGVPVLFGLQCFGADLKTANISIGSPAYALMAKHTAELARYLNLPSRCGGSTTDALCVSPQSGYEGMLSMNQMLNEYQQPQFDTAIKSELDNSMMFQGVDKTLFTDIQDLIAS